MQVGVWTVRAAPEGYGGENQKKMNPGPNHSENWGPGFTVHMDNGLTVQFGCIHTVISQMKTKDQEIENWRPGFFIFLPSGFPFLNQPV